MAVVSPPKMSFMTGLLRAAPSSMLCVLVLNEAAPDAELAQI